MTPTNIHELWISWLLVAFKGWRNISVELLNAGLEGADAKQWGWKPGLPQLIILLYGSTGFFSEGQSLTGNHRACMPPSHWCILPWGKPFSVGLFFGTVEISVIKLNTPFWKGRVIGNKWIFSCSHSFSDFICSHPYADKSAWAGEAPLWVIGRTRDADSKNLHHVSWLMMANR